MELSEVQKKLKDYESKITPIPVGKVTTVKKASVVPDIPAAAPVAQAKSPGGPCFNKCFAELLKAIPPTFIGNDVSDLAYMLLDQFPQCGEIKTGAVS